MLDVEGDPSRFVAGSEFRVPSSLGRLAAPALLCGGLAAGLVYGVQGRSAQIFGASSYRGSGLRRSVALTFDDGPSEGTLRLLDYLAEEGVSATFFQCGANVARHGGVARRVAEAGHEIGNHTYTHRRLCPQLSRSPNLLGPAEVLWEFASAQKRITEETGAVPTLLRAPYGMRWFGLAAAQRKLGLHGVMWTAIGNDWALPAEQIVARLLGGLAPGAIFCLHDGRDIRPDPDITATLAATRRLVPRLKDAGYGFETVSQILS